MDMIDGTLHEYVTGMVGGELFGLPIGACRTCFMPERVTRVPLAPPEVAGILNLRGRIVTLIDMRLRLGLERIDSDEPVMAIGVELRGKSYGLLVDAVGEVLKLDEALCERNPINLDPRLASVSAGIYRLEGQLMIMLDIDRVLDIAGREQNSRMTTQVSTRARDIAGRIPRRGSEGAMKTCLVVDDSKVIRKVARHILETLNLRCARRGTARSARFLPPTSPT